MRSLCDDVMCSADGVRIAIVLTRGKTIDCELNQHMNTSPRWCPGMSHLVVEFLLFYLNLDLGLPFAVPYALLTYLKIKRK